MVIPMLLLLASHPTFAADPTPALPKGCTADPDPDAPTVERLRCPEGVIVRAPAPTDASGHFDPATANAALGPLLQLPTPTAPTDRQPLLSEEKPGGISLGGQPARAWPLSLDGRQGWLVEDPTSPHPRAVGCLEAGVNAADRPWCQVALESLWGPAAGPPLPGKDH